MLDLYVVVGILTLLNVVQVFVTQRERKRSDERERLYIKAIMAKDVGEFAMAEESPEQRIERTKEENTLAIKAAELERERNNNLGIPVRS